MTLLASYASHPGQSRGRLHAEPGGEVRGPRDMFQRDRDRIIHSIAFRRLRHKTQVFVSPDGDHFRVRLTHSLEVAQIGRTTARTLGLNEDLTEALCLAHDIGHPPFGHAGEDALEAALDAHGGFDHNAHTLRTLMLLESPYPLFRGLNLSWEMLEGLAKHNGPVTRPGWAMREVDALFPLDLASHASLEAQLAAIADDIAYDNHDIDDGLRAGLLTLDQLLGVPLVKGCWDRVRARYPDVPEDRLLRELVREQIGVMANDLIAATRANILAAGVETADDVRRAGRPLVGFSPELAAQERDLKRFMYATLYHHPSQLAAADRARVIVTDLFRAYQADPKLMPQEWRDDCATLEPRRSRHIADFIAGMTDRYAEKRHAEIFGELALA
ncbi:MULTISPECIES: deoxyguanosinetriphosphate triphosphohydrolase [Sphingobium]|nr:MULTISPECIES: deoxyguanosinetriphosphate triphosphohydrolase [Sphingobium]OAP30126.1 deoxyguanosinetriphosphate triphosphohydrolase [Sphingobium sp. 20006FA]AJR22554.1 deoxyguanosinetriphosphate triphosphohydrolase [Sphingobium sp. YBL2]KXU30568.1 deoxyguanosinetriphosphate triphosphohydrolase [Sphingobium sp. AM]KYC30449.1 deoxyguanosinetriphosphate triphosphohydrolase [Sphingobium sp. 22B]RYM00925.1 deoxyguanosinetriphosphate triphosphohydrolase [Sphingobium fuliginis]